MLTKYSYKTRKQVGLVAPSQIKARREAFERKKLTKAFKAWRVKQFKKQKGLCAICRRPILGVWVTDHIKPLARGGTSAYSNLQLTDWQCNMRKGYKMPRENALRAR